jgi:hypothetical protein
MHSGHDDVFARIPAWRKAKQHTARPLCALAPSRSADLQALRRTPSRRLLTISASYALGFPLALAAVWVRDTTLFLILATLAVYLSTFYFPCLAPLLHQVTSLGLRAPAMGLYLIAGYLRATRWRPC